MKTYHDLPRKELMKCANDMLAKYANQEPEIHFKFTCEKCGERCTLSAPNKLYENGECFKCGHETKIEKGGLTICLHTGHEQFT